MMKTNFRFIQFFVLFLGVLSCTAQTKKPNKDTSGIYVFEKEDTIRNTYIMLYNENNAMKGHFFGSEKIANGDILFFQNEMQNLKLNNTKISFDIGERKLYKTSQLGIKKSAENRENFITTPTSKEKLKFSGKIKDAEIILNCNSTNCTDKTLNFQKVTAK